MNTESENLLIQVHSKTIKIIERKSCYQTARQSFRQTKHSFQNLPEFQATSIHFRPISLTSRLQVQSQIKKRYQRMVQLQHKSFIERHQLEKQRENNIKQSKERVEARTKELREKFNHLGHSARELQFRHRCEGAELRQQRLVNHRYCVQRDNCDLERKKRVVSKRQKGFRLQGPWKRQEGQKVTDLGPF